MEGINIVPRGYLNETQGQKYHMSLYQEIIKKDEYLDFYKQIRNISDSFIIMDNGAAEGCNPTPEELLDAYRLLEPHEIVLPDVVSNRQETQKQSLRALNLFTSMGLHRQYQIMAVPQGTTFTQWLSCATTFIRQPEITTIGVSKFVSKLLKDNFNPGTNVRKKCVEHLLAIMKAYGREDMQIHLLGCYYDVGELTEIEKAFPGRVRSTDSAIAYVFARNGKTVGTGERPDQNEIDFHSSKAVSLDLLQTNLAAYQKACRG